MLYNILDGFRYKEYFILLLLLLFYVSSNFLIWFISISCVLILYVSKLDSETSILFAISIIGLTILIQTNNLLEFYISLEIVSLIFYVLAARDRKSVKSTESGLKYFILGSLSSGLILLGITLVYAQTGIIDLILIFDQIEFELSWVLVKIGLLFKLGSAPFHIWIPDVYEGSPIIVTIFLAIVPKIAYISILMRISFGGIDFILLMSGVLSIIVGAIGALNQSKIKRLLGYSAIGHMGFILLGLSTGTFLGFKSLVIYLIIYVLMILNSFTLIKELEISLIIELRGLSRRNRVIGLTQGAILMSIAGIPPLAGFYSKYIILCSILDLEMLFTSLFVILWSVVSVYYYLSLIRWMYFEDFSEVSIVLTPISFNSSIILGLTTYVVLSIMIYPEILHVAYN